MADELAVLDRELWELGERRNRVAVELGNRRWAASKRARQADELSGRPAAPSPGPRSAEWTVDRVRSVLLWVGATLLTASALTFTTVAWAHLGDGGRALLLAAVTALCVGGALALRRRLPATAEAFTALSIALAVIDWQALRRAGLTAGMSTTASWAIGSLVVSAVAFALGTAVGKRTTRVAIALLLPLAFELTVSTLAGASWAFALGFSLVAGTVALARRRVRSHSHDRPVEVALMTHIIATWSLSAVLVAIATVQTDTFAQVLVPASIVLTLTLAPLALLRRDSTPNDDAGLATVVCALVAASFVVAASNTLGPQGMLAWATVVAAVLVVLAPSLPRRWTTPAWTTGVAFGGPGLVHGSLAALTAILAPTAWLSDAWQGSLAMSARDAFEGPHSTATWSFGAPAVVALIASAAAIAGIAIATRRRSALVPVPWAVAAIATITTFVVCVAPVIAGASAGVVCATTMPVFGALVLAGAVLDRSQPRLAGVLLPIAILPAIATMGWASLTQTASIVVLAIACVVAVCATTIAASDETRTALAAFAGATVITLVAVATAASVETPATVGFAMVLASGGAVILGVHGRRRTFEGTALEVVGATGLVVGLLIAVQGTPWFAGSLTAMVPMLAIAAFERERTQIYSVAASAAAVAAMWAWLGAAHVTVVEAYTAPAASMALAVGLLEWRRGPARSWLALGPAIVLGLGPTLVLGIAQDDSARTIVAAVMAFAIVALGAWKQLQAPLVLGSLALLALALNTFGPALARLPRWLPLAVIGVLLMWIGATFETRRNRARSATETLMHFG